MMVTLQGDENVQDSARSDRKSKVIARIVAMAQHGNNDGGNGEPFRIPRFRALCFTHDAAP